MSTHVARGVARLRGEVTVPGDKSISHRALVLAALAEGTSTLQHRARGADQESMAACLRQLGVEIKDVNSATRVVGVGLRGLLPPQADLECGNSGATMRFLAGALAATPGLEARLVGDASLSRRPMARVARPLALLGADVRTAAGGTAPLEVTGSRLRGGSIEIDVPSAQVKTAVLLAALQADGVTALREPVRTRDHTEMLLRRLGVDLEVGEVITLQPPSRIEAFELAVPGDPSSAAFWAVVAACHPDAELIIRGVCLNPTRIGFLEVLSRMGADVGVENPRPLGGELVGDLVIRSSALHGTEVTAAEIPSLVDEVPVLALAAAVAAGETRFRGLAELRHKEVDRVEAIASQLGLLGAGLAVQGDDLVVEGPTRLRGGAVSALGDHRMAMTLVLAGTLASGETQVEGAGVAAVSYPDFFIELDRLGSA
ncbi:MAG TPA: 3-phosphoshikimate 1-carboxyvinyltransferase [Candidatus Dormibacteraeota bacterium]